MRMAQLLLIMFYAAYMTQVGMILLLLPWSELWPRLLHQLPPHLAYLLDLPACRGLISGIGALHIMALLLELLPPSVRRRLIG